ncbi:MAG: T9SS type A sorting domain-containing protein [Flavobacteriales bacterium]|nr:T9SS type A sorting domain-containing protein [Flavobacteriales bacterium]
MPGSPCDDGNADTSDDLYSAACVCWGQDCAGTYGGNALPGTPCDDGNPNTSSDTWQTGCICEGGTGVDERAAGIVRVSPNPTRDIIAVELARSGGSVAWELRDLAGQVVLGGSHQGETRMVIDAVSIASGTYLLTIERNGMRGQHRVVKQ